MNDESFHRSFDDISVLHARLSFFLDQFSDFLTSSKLLTKSAQEPTAC